jgi:hypothetical protein
VLVLDLLFYEPPLPLPFVRCFFSSRSMVLFAFARFLLASMCLVASLVLLVLCVQAARLKFSISI